MAEDISEIKKILKEEKVVLGTKRTIENLKLGKIKRVYLSSNAPESVKEEIKNYSKISNVKVVQLKLPNDELGTACKKRFSISVFGVAKA
jgi:large subunit ribosomal protein L30e